MGKSLRKHQKCKIAGHSDKRDKRLTNRRFRRLEKIRMCKENYDRLPKSVKDVSDTWSFSSDGLAMWFDRHTVGDEYFSKLMRK
jgi:hypothetical protein